MKGIRLYTYSVVAFLAACTVSLHSAGVVHPLREITQTQAYTAGKQKGRIDGAHTAKEDAKKQEKCLFSPESIAKVVETVITPARIAQESAFYRGTFDKEAINLFKKGWSEGYVREYNLAYPEALRLEQLPVISSDAAQNLGDRYGFVEGSREGVELGEKNYRENTPEALQQKVPSEDDKNALIKRIMNPESLSRIRSVEGFSINHTFAEPFTRGLIEGYTRGRLEGYQSGYAQAAAAAAEQKAAENPVVP